jgi:DNA-binding YbaB/EbfC family protein
MFGKLGQIFSLLNNPAKIQEEMQKFQQALGQIVADGDAGAGMVKVRVNGRRELVSCQLGEEAFKAGDKELLEDLIKAATNQALQKVQQQVAEESAKMAANLGLPAGAMGMGMPGMV